MRTEHPLTRQLHHQEDGSTLALLPAALLVVLGLGAVAVDAAALFLAQRQTLDLAATIALDAASALDEEAFYDHGELRLDPVRVEHRRATAVAVAREVTGLEQLDCRAVVDHDRVAVTCEASARPVLGVLWRGDGGARQQVSGTEVARAATRGGEEADG